MYRILLLISFPLFLFSQNIVLTPIINGLSTPVEMTHANDDRIFIIEKAGIIKVFTPDALVLSDFLNITNRVNSAANERGLLGLAFSPNFATDGKFYVHYSDLNGNTVISEFLSNNNIGDPNSETILLTVSQPYSNHNGGKITFGSDGYLYIGLGDGGSGGDPQNNAQNGNSLLGKLLRIDVSTNPYSIPSDNPFVGDNSVADEVFALGLRNPWKFSFDKDTDDLWIADVGQNAIEEINFETDASGLNFGWRCYEGNNTYNISGCAAASNYTFPISFYTHSSNRCSITGGYVYRGEQYPDLEGKYIFGDYCSGELGMVDSSNNTLTWVLDTSYFISSMGEDANGELYVLNIANGTLYQIQSTLGVEDVPMQEVEIQFNSPVEEYLKINSTQVMSHIRIYSSDGKLLVEKPLENELSIEQSLIEFTSGVYFFEVRCKDSNTYLTRKFIKK